MKKIVMVLMLFTSIPVSLCAQEKSGSDKAFSIPDDIIMTRRFYINLDNGNKVTIEVTDFSDLQRISNMDSLLQMFRRDMIPFKDSFSDPLTAKRIDFSSDAKGRKKIRIQQFQPAGSAFLLSNGEISSLKVAQDTINIIGVINDPSKPFDRIPLNETRYYHLVFYLNKIGELTNYMNGILNEKIMAIRDHINGKWPTVLGTGYHYLKADSAIYGPHPKGITDAGQSDFIELSVSVNVANYKNYFVPSFSLGTQAVFANRSRSYKWVPGLFWEPHFLFAKDSNGKLHTYRNDFLTLTYGQGGTKDHNPRKEFSFSAVLSLGYLIHREGDLMDKNTFRFGAGKLKLTKTTIEPSIYFNNFFKGVTPCIRISQQF